MVDRDAITGFVRDTLAELLHVRSVADDRPFRELGLDSAGLVTLLERVSGFLGRPVPAWVGWQYGTVAALSGHLAGDPAAPVVARSRSAADEPVAIVGLGCRLPGGIESPGGLWAALAGGLDAVREVPGDRWPVRDWVSADPDAPGKMTTRWGGFLDDVAGFDADFFRIAPVEATQMDPQQRVALEVAWSAVEDARLLPADLAGSRTGVFFGTMWQEYHEATAAAELRTHSAVGADNSIIPARIAYALGLRGPVMAVATACSSSLTAVHLAVRSLRDGESDVALAGGVSLMLSPRTTVAMTKFGAMNPDGQCRAFDAGAGGYVRGEGCGVVVLRRLSDALRDGDRIYAVVRGSAVNSDGASNGLTAPNPQAQVEVLRAAWSSANVVPAEVSYVEAHGTGTPLGDPIEAAALGEVFGPGRESPLRIGSAKTNFGHLEPAAGVLGVLKAALSLYHGELPASLHFDEPNPHIDFAAQRLSVVTEPSPWPAAEHRYAGVSGFGFGGTNAHVALGEAPYRRRVLARLSGVDDASLSVAAAEVAWSGVDSAGPVGDAGGSVPASAVRRVFLPVGHRSEVQAALAASVPVVVGEPPRVVFFFSGHGAQWLGMARDLVGEPVFRAVLDECSAAIGWSVVDELLTGELDRTDVIQPVLFAVQVGLARQLAAWGVRPDAVFGQSVGEVAAAVVAGALSLAEGARVITIWSALVAERVGGRGALLVCESAEAGRFPGLAVAGRLSATQIALSGPVADVAAAERELGAAGVRVHRVAIDYASHHPSLAALIPELVRRLGTIECREPEVPFLSTVTGRPVTSFDVVYVAANMCGPMLVADAVTALRADGPVRFVEVGPHPVMRPALGADALATCRRGRSAREGLEDLAGALWCAGVEVDWAAVTRSSTPAVPVPLVVSGRTEGALADNAGRLADLLAGGDVSLADVALSAGSRTAFDHRGAVVASTVEEAVAGLRNLPITGTARSGGLAMLFTGQGAQRPGMGVGLRVFPVFAEAFDAALGVVGDVSRTEFAQPALFAFEVALYRLWESWGVTPDVVAGHSVGEFAAAHVAGVLSLEDAVRLVVARGRLMQACRADGAMVSIEAAESEITLTEGVSVAGLNGPRQTVISGDEAAVLALAATFEGRRTRRLDVSHAFHSGHMDAMLDEFAEVVASCEFRKPEITVVSTLTGEVVTDFSGDYWVRQARGAVRFLDAVRTVEAAGVSRYLECGPAAVLSAMAAACVLDEDAATFVPSVRNDEATDVIGALAALHTDGQPVDWNAVFPGAARTDLPPYAFQHERFWLDQTPAAPSTLYEQAWQPVTLDPAVPAGTWLLVAPPGPEYAEAFPGAHVLPNAETREEFADLLAGHTDIAGVVTFTPLDVGGPCGTSRTLALTQALGDHRVKAPLWMVTRGAVRAADGDTVPRAWQAQPWGLGHVLALEHPYRWGGLVDLPEDDVPALLAAAVAGGEEYVALRADAAYARRLRRVDPPAGAWRGRGTALVTGGSGALATHLARWLTGRGVEHVVLASRSGAVAPGLGDRVTGVSCDVSDPAAVAGLLSEIDGLRSVFHTAGVLDDKLLASLDMDSVNRVAGPKLAGAWALHELTKDRDLDAFVLFSSIVGVLGNVGQANYAMANAGLDALAEHRRAAGLPAVGVAWGPWDDGMADGRIGDQFRESGMVPMPAGLALTGLDHALLAGRPLMVADVDWTLAVPALSEAGPRSLLGELAPAPEPAANPLAAELAGLDAAGLAAVVAEEAAAVLGVRDPASLDPDRGYTDLGFDSMMATDFARRVQRRTGIRTSRTLVFDRPTIDAVARWLLEELADAAPAERAERAARVDEPLAIVGAGLRMPGGATDLDSLWRVLAEGRDTVVPIPADRFPVDAWFDADPEAEGRTYVRHASLLDDVASFDAAFFGISPREAESMDPQHRLLLEAAWHALEDAGIRPGTLRDSATGVFVGAGPGEYGKYRQAADNDAYALTGALPSFNAGRLAYHLRLQGPALSVDTACSSSLVALHLAGEALRSGECDLALAGGVQVLADPGSFVALSRAQALAPDGRSKTFSDDADGYGRGEGVGVLALMRLSDALERDRPVLGVLRASAVNHDGASSGITAPNGSAQQKVLRSALRAAGLEPSDVDYVECHGTGTALGDPIEVQALAAVYGEGRTAPLGLGTAKSVIGHLESAAGVAGVCKVLAALRHGALPATRHSSPRNHNVAWDELPVAVVDELTPWAAGSRPRRAGVSSFGLSGTNAHVIVEEPPASPPVPVTRVAPVPVVVSGKDAESLALNASRLADRLADGDLPLADVAVTAASRTAFAHRGAVVASTVEEAVAGLRNLPITGTARSGGLAMLFTGQGAQRQDMGVGLRVFPVFAEAYDAALGAAGDVSRTEFAQPALFAFEVALYRLWESWGVTPDAVAGHSVGEFAAAHVAGVLSLDDAVKLVVARGRLMQACRADGAMVSIEAAESEIELTEGVSIAGLNGPQQTVISGDEAAVLALAESFVGRRTRRLDVSHAFHSGHMDAMLDEFADVVASCTFRAPEITVVSTLTGEVVTDFGGDYWVRQARGAVRFLDAMSTLDSMGVAHYVECGPGGVLSAMGAACLPEDTTAVFLPSTRPDTDEAHAVVAALAGLHVAGHDLDWTGGNRVSLPGYAFRRDRHWSDVAAASDLTAVGLEAAPHPWLRAVTSTADDGLLLTGRLSLAEHPWLADHTVFDTVVVPGTGILELALAAAQHAGAAGVAELTLAQPLVLPATGHVRLQVTVDGSRAVAVHSRRDSQDGWTTHATGLLTDESTEPGAAVPTGGSAVATGRLYDTFTRQGIGYGPAFRGLIAMTRNGSTGHGAVELPATATTGDYELHPALLDAALHVILGLREDTERVLLPFEWRGVTVHAAAAGTVYVTIDLDGPDADGSATARIHVADPTGRPVADIDELRLRAATAEQIRAGEPVEHLYRVEHRPVTLTGDTPGRTVVDLTDTEGDPAAQALAALQETLAGDGELVFLTRGLATAAVAGLVRTARTEHPDRVLRVVEAGSTTHLDAAIAADEPELLLRGDEILAPRLARVTADTAAGAPTFDPERTVLLTGGVGELGRLFATHLVTRYGVRRLLLTSRRGHAPDLVAELAALGATAEVAACDVTDRDALAALLSDVDLGAVLHLAGVLDDGLVTGQDADRLARVLAPKVTGARNLHELTRDRDLTAFVLFSSVAGVLGSAGQSTYAAANTYLDALAAHRHAEGLPATSLSWGLWEGDGMAAQLGQAELARLRRQGIGALTARQGLAAFDAALAQPDAHLVPARLELTALRRELDRGGEAPAMLRGLVRAGRRRASATTASSLRDQLLPLAPEQRREQLTQLVRKEVGTILGGSVGATQVLKDAGMDSLMAVELRRHLSTETGVLLPATLAFDYPTATAIAGLVADRMFADERADSAELVTRTQLDALVELLRTATPSDLGDPALARRLLELHKGLSAVVAEAAAEPEPEVDLEQGSQADLLQFLDRKFGASA